MPKLVRVAWWWTIKAGTPEVEHDLLAVLRELPTGHRGVLRLVKRIDGASIQIGRKA